MPDKSIVDAANYHEMSKPFSSHDEANAAVDGFWEEFYALRNKYRLADVHVIISVNVEDGACFLSMHAGSSTQAERMTAWAFGKASAERQQQVSQLCEQAMHRQRNGVDPAGGPPVAERGRLSMAAQAVQMTFAEYLAYPAVSSSLIRAGLAGGLDSMLYASQGGSGEDTKAMRLGRAAHCQALTPLLFPEAFPVIGQCQGTTGKGEQCQYGASLLCDVEGQVRAMCGTHAKKYEPVELLDYIRGDEVDGIAAMAKKLARVKELTGDGQAEQSIIFELCGVQCKSRLDWHARRHIGELKTCTDYPTMDMMQREVTSRRYHVQARLQQHAIEYLTGERKPFFWIFQQSVPPFATNRMQADEDTLAAADFDIQRMLIAWRVATVSGWFPDPYDEGIRIEGGLTKWARKEYEDMASQITVEGSSA